MTTTMHLTRQTFVHVLHADSGPESWAIQIDATPGDEEARQFWLTADAARELGIGLIVAADRLEKSPAADNDEDSFGVHRAVDAQTTVEPARD